MSIPKHDFVVVVDFGSRQSQTIARRVRECNVYCEVWPYTTTIDAFIRRGAKGVVWAEGPVHSSEAKTAYDALQASVKKHAIPARGFETDERGLRSFLTETCGIQPTWTSERFIEEQIEQIRETVGSTGRVVCGLSGGVDSSVAATLVHRALGDRLFTIFVDHGLMRKGEPEQVIEIFGERFGSGFVYVDAKERFLSKLAGVVDPEKKRQIIGEEFIRVFEEEAKKIGDVRYLVQGTVYPDVIESGVGGAMVKSHHNVGGLPERMELSLIEPLRYLFKDEVRHVGETLGIPKALVWRQPFPGPGLAIRIMGEVTRERVEIERACDAVVTEELAAAGLMDEIWQSFAVLTETRSVGVQDDGRTYGYVASVRAVTAVDGMTAEWARIPYDVLDRISLRIMEEVAAVGRVVYDISSKPPATIEWE